MLRATLKSLLAHKLRLALTAMSIVLGVGFVAGSFVFTDTLNATFNRLFRSVDAGIDVQVRSVATFTETERGGPQGTHQPVPDTLLDQVRGIAGVRAADGQVGGYAQMLDKHGKAIGSIGPPTIGVSYSDVPGLSSLSLRAGRRPNGPGEVAIDANTAKKHHFRVGDHIRILLTGPPQEFAIVGTVGLGNADSLGGATLAAFDLRTAQQVLDHRGTFDDVNVKAAADVSQAELRDRIAAAVGPRYEVLTQAEVASDAANQITKNLKFLTVFLLVFAGVALFVGTFVISNTFLIIVAQRTRELGLLRALGAHRRQVMRSVLTEAGITAVVASAVGVGFGILVAFGIQALVGALGGNLPRSQIVIASRTIILSMAVGIVVTMVSAVGPALRATRVSPMAALREAALPRLRARRSRAVAGATAGAVGLLLLAVGLLGGGSGAPVSVGAGVFLVFLGVAFEVALVARPLARLIGAPAARWRALPGRLGRENAMRNPRRTASTANALMIGLALVTLVSVLAASATASANRAIDRVLTADYVISPKGFGPGFSPDVATQLRATRGIALVAEERNGQWRLNGTDHRLEGVNPTEFAPLISLKLVAGRLPARNDDALLVTAKQATSHRWTVGSIVPMEFAKTGVHGVRVAAVFAKNDAANDYLLTMGAYERNFTSQKDTDVLVKAAPGVSADASRKAVDSVTNAFPTLDVRDQAQFKANGRKQVNQVLTFVTGLLLLAILIAFLGIVNTLALSVFERTRELGLLRAVGMSRRQVRSMVRWESIIISVLGAVVGVVVGVFFGWALVSSLSDQGVSELVVPFSRLVAYVVVAGLLGTGAAVFPAFRAARLDVLAAIAHE